MKNFLHNTTRTLVTAAGVVALAFIANNAHAVRMSHVTSNTVNNGNGTYTYNFEVFNDSHFPCPLEAAVAGDAAAAISDPSDCLLHRIKEWSLPYFSDSGITNISSIPNTFGFGEPNLWTWAIETVGVANDATGYDGATPTWMNPTDPFYFGASSPFSAVTMILRWYAVDYCGDGCFGLIRPQESLAGFSFVSTYAATAAPYDAGWRDEPLRSGDPDFPLTGIPNSPSVGGNNAVPLPAPLSLLLVGIALVGFVRRANR